MKTRHLIALLLSFALPAPAAAGTIEEMVEITVRVEDIQSRIHQHTMWVTVFRDEAREKSPFIVMSHGRSKPAARAQLGRARYEDNAHYFVSKGFAVFIPTRIGYGVTGGPDVESSGNCAQSEFLRAFEAGADQVMAVIRHARAQYFVDPERGVLLGQSVGGAITLALSAKNVDGVVAAINFAGGSGGDPEVIPENPCAEARLVEVFSRYGQTSKIPSVWLYSENDRYWGKHKPREWFKAFRSSGGAAEFVQLPPFKPDGHMSFTENPDGWKPAVEQFLGSIGLLK